MAAVAYGSADNVKTILGEMVKFSGNISLFNPGKNNKGTINLYYAGLTMDDAYKGKLKRFEFRFETANDLTRFNVYREIGTSGSKMLALLATGNTATNLTVANVFVINHNSWVGSAVLNDVFIIETDSHRSNDELEFVRNDVSAEIDNELRRKSIIVSDEGTIPDDLYFDTDVPNEIATCADYLSAFYLVDDILRADRGMKISGAEEGADEDVVAAYRWKKRATTALNRYIEIAMHSEGNAPRYSSVAPLQQNIGIDNVEGGIRENEIDTDQTEEGNDEFDNIYDEMA